MYQLDIHQTRHTVFLQSDAAAATIHFTAHFVQLQFEGSVYFFGKPETSMKAG